MGARTVSFPRHAALRLRQRAARRLRLGRLVWATGACACATLLVLRLARPTAPADLAIPLLLLLLCLYLWWRAAGRSERDRASIALEVGAAGEGAVERHLAEELPPSYVVLNNLP